MPILQVRFTRDRVMTPYLAVVDMVTMPRRLDMLDKATSKKQQVRS